MLCFYLANIQKKTDFKQLKTIIFKYKLE